MQRLRTARTTRSQRLLEVLSDYERVVVVMHDNPDPDAIASGWAVHALVEEKLGKPARVVGGGAIVRAENRQLVELLSAPIELVSAVEADEGTAAVLVDCGLETANHVLTRGGPKPVAVIDHHEDRGGAAGLRFRDIRPEVAAAASIAASYLREQKIDAGPKLATAILYALRTETRGAQTKFSRLDRLVWLWAARSADHSLLAEIEGAPLSRSYFGDLVLALESAMLYGDAALCLLPRARNAEIVGEVADLLIRCEGVRRVLCGAVIGCELLLSARSTPGAGRAIDLLRETLRGLGSGGGHAFRAGGKIACVGEGPCVPENLQVELRDRWLRACGIEAAKPSRLIDRREIEENL